MFVWMIPLLIFIAVFLLAHAMQKWGREIRLHRRALALIKSAARDDHETGDKRSSLTTIFFRLLPLLAGWQAKWVPTVWKMRVEKKIARIPEWADRSAAEWLVVKEFSCIGGIFAGMIIGGGNFFTLLLGITAFFLPDLWLRERETARRKAIMRELPDMLDLLACCMEAGLGFEQAVDIILERNHQGYLYQEFNDMMQAIRMGRSRRDALQSMGKQVGDSDFTTFITALIQAERMGVSVAATLKQQAGQLRSKRAQAVEKQALEAPVKLLFPLIVFIFPVVFMVIFGPIIIRFMQGF